MQNRWIPGLLWVVSAAACPRPARPIDTIAVSVQATATTAAASELRGDLSPPFTLTASDGSGLALVRVAAKAVVAGPLAFTELHLDFRNDEARVREGTFQITLPARAAVSRFAMESGGQWMEAEVVHKLVARRAYEDFLHRRQDPALLDKAAGNQFSARVFPIAAGAENHLVISYSEELPGQHYTLPLRGLPMAERVDVELSSIGSDGARTSQQLAERDWQPDRDFVAASAAPVAAIGAGDLVAAQVELAGGAGREAPRGVTLLVDTSASRALGFAAYVASIRRMIGELRATWGDGLPLQIVAFDQDPELVFDGRAADADLAKLVERGAAGASDLGQALAWIARRGGIQPRVVIVGDGVITAGLEGRELAAAVQQLPGVERLDVVLAGGLRDEAAAAQLVRAGLAHTGAVLDLERDAVAAALGDAVATDLPVDVAGAAWVYPRTIASARAGTMAIVYARLPERAESVDVVVSGVHHAQRVVAGAAPLIERAIAGAELRELEAKLATVNGDEATAVRAAIAAKSVATRVLSSETSMLVLESDGDYARYGIDRRALTDILAVGADGVERMHRQDIAAIPPRVAGSRRVAARDDVAAEPPRAGEAPPPPPREIEPASTAPRTDGAEDRDADGIPDDNDGCPDEAETFNGFQDEDGCPDRGRVIVTSEHLEILDNVYFEPDRDTIQRASLPILDAIAAVLVDHADITLLEVQGHTDEVGDAAYNLALSERRAAAVTAYLVGKGIAASRLDAKGYGETQPLDRAHSPAAWAKNRRVAFLILRRTAEAEPVAATPSTPRPSPPTSSTPSKPPGPPPAVTGELAAIQKAVAAKDLDGALAKARDWHAREPGNVLALVGLGEALEARRADAAAARIYGSIIDLFPRRADLRRFAGERLSRLSAARDLAIDSFRRAVADRPDHLTGHRLLAYALVRAGRLQDGFAAIVAGLDQKYRDGSFAGGMRVLGEDAGMIGAVYAAAAPAKRAEIAAVLAKHKLSLATSPSTRFILYWETDANDVDFHIQDAHGGHAFFSQKRLASGGELYADVTTGYGPECFAIPGAPAAGPYQLSIDYYAQGPMGYGMGLLQIQTFDPKTGLRFEDRPYVVMTNRAKLDLGSYR